MSLRKFLITGLTLLALAALAMTAWGASRLWVCEFCGKRVHTGEIPPTGGCHKNPFGKKVHHWVED